MASISMLSAIVPRSWRAKKEKGRLPAPDLQLRKETAAKRCPVIGGTSQPRQVSGSESCNLPRAASPSLRSAEHREQATESDPWPRRRFACMARQACAQRIMPACLRLDLDPATGSLRTPREACAPRIMLASLQPDLDLLAGSLGVPRSACA